MKGSNDPNKKLRNKTAFGTLYRKVTLIVVLRNENIFICSYASESFNKLLNVKYLFGIT